MELTFVSSWAWPKSPSLHVDAWFISIEFQNEMDRCLAWLKLCWLNNYFNGTSTFFFIALIPPVSKI